MLEQKVSLNDTITLFGESLFSKYGFDDGDLLDDVLDDLLFNPYEYDDHSIEGFSLRHRVLFELVEQFLLPAIPRKIETCQIHTIHNPIRAVGGQSNEGLEDISVDVTYGQIKDIAMNLSSKKNEV